MHRVVSAYGRLVLSAHPIILTSLGGEQPTWVVSFLSGAGKNNKFFVFKFLVLAIRWNSLTPLFILLLRILTSYLFKCCAVVTESVERIPETRSSSSSSLGSRRREQRLHPWSGLVCLKVKAQWRTWKGPSAFDPLRWTVSRSSAVPGNEWASQPPHPQTALNTECQAGGKFQTLRKTSVTGSVWLSHATYWVTPTGAGCAQRTVGIEASEQFVLWWINLGSDFNYLVIKGIMSVTAFLQKIDPIAMNGLVVALTP